MADLGETVLNILADRDGFNTLDIAEELNVDHQKTVGAVKSLLALGDVSVHCIWLAVAVRHVNKLMKSLISDCVSPFKFHWFQFQIHPV